MDEKCAVTTQINAMMWKDNLTLPGCHSETWKAIIQYTWLFNKHMDKRSVIFQNFILTASKSWMLQSALPLWQNIPILNKP